MDRKPNFFIVGAPKCGTTAMHKYLQAHPDIFMSQVKEPYFFGQDLIYHNFEKITKKDYFDLFEEARDEKILGEASTTYLVSKQAALEIKRSTPNAKILIMLRNPADMMYSLHSQLLFTRVENVKDFEQALALENSRKEGKNVPEFTTILNFLFYKEFAQYTAQVKRYFQAFGKENVKVIIFDDFKKDLSGTYKQTLKFLGVDDKFSPNTFEIVNANKKRQNEWLSNLFQKPLVIGATRTFLPSYDLRKKLAQKLSFFTIKHICRPSMTKNLRAKLNKDFLPEIKKLELLIDHELTSWCKSEKSYEMIT